MLNIFIVFFNNFSDGYSFLCSVIQYQILTENRRSEFNPISTGQIYHEILKAYQLIPKLALQK